MLSKTWKKIGMIELSFYIGIIIIFVYILSTIGIKIIEPFENNPRFIVKKGNDIYDTFYVNIYDDLLFSDYKNMYEIGLIMSKTNPTKHSFILDIGSGTGHHVGALNSKGFQCEGVDISKSMINKSKINYPKCKFRQGDAIKSILYQPQTFTHIMCLYFTIYMIKNKRQFFQNCMSWLKPGGYLVLHLVNRNTFDPILPIGDVLYQVDPQKYASKRITSTKAAFQNHLYKANFTMNNSTDIASLDETFTHRRDHSVRKQQHELYMPTQKKILSLAADAGFKLISKSEMSSIQYNNQFIYFLQKPK